MVLATIITIEQAYPGLRILAGDNSQYLSIVTAHGVIMVFFMAMPLLFGFFTNFLLPTQLGVRDVAFPRMNSAAFWFLPASLIVLCQLVCIDRRYQRMNCFNVRELQSLVRKKFFMDLTQNNDLRFNLDNSVLGLKNKLNSKLTNNSYNLYANLGVSDDFSRVYNSNLISSGLLNSNQKSLLEVSNLESLVTKRYVQSDYPSLLYRVKVGNYLPDVPMLRNYEHIVNTISHKTISNRSDMWVFTTKINSIFKDGYLSYNKFNYNLNLGVSSAGPYTSHLSIFILFNYFKKEFK